jgi:hypothetical protein
LILTEGQRQGNVEVLNIDENAGSVRVNNSGTIVTLTFEKDGAKLPNTPPPPTVPPGLPSPTNANLRPPATLPTALPVRGAAGVNPHLRSVRTRDLRSPNVLGAAEPPVPANPVGTVGSASAPVPTANSLPTDLTPDEQAIVLELQRQSGLSPGSTSSVPQTAVPGALVPTAPVLPQ